MKKMSFDKIIEEFENMGIETTHKGSAGNFSIQVKFEVGERRIEGKFSKSWDLTPSGGESSSVISYIYEYPNNITHLNQLSMIPQNQTEFYEVIKELKTTKKTLLEIYNKKQIESDRKKMDKLKQRMISDFYLYIWKKYNIEVMKGNLSIKEANTLQKQDEAKFKEMMEKFG